MRFLIATFLVTVSVLSGVGQSTEPRMVVIDSSKFAWEKDGIRRLVQAYDISMGCSPFSMTVEQRKAAYDRRIKMLVDPVNADIDKVLDSYLEERGMVLLLDVGNHWRTVIWINNQIDITKDFIAHYNNLDHSKR